MRNGQIGWQEGAGGGWKTGECPLLRAGNPEAIETHIYGTDIHQFSTHVTPSGLVSIGPTLHNFAPTPGQNKQRNS